ncbi:hypothetical protein HDU84_000557, partial [Entophlyctis sp. JEL0112]
MTCIFHHHCQQTFRKRTQLIPLDQLPLSNVDIQDAYETSKEFKLSQLLPQSRGKHGASSLQRLAQYGDKQDEVIISTPEDNFGSQSLDQLQSSENFEPHVVLTAEESLLERYPVSYLNPIFSKPLSRPWLPVAVA